jgi:integrase
MGCIGAQCGTTAVIISCRARSHSPRVTGLGWGDEQTARAARHRAHGEVAQASETLRAHDRQLLPSIPKVRVLTENNTRQGFFERPDLEAVVTALPDYLRDFNRFAYLTGWRKGEIISLKWTVVDRDDQKNPIF